MQRRPSPTDLELGKSKFSEAFMPKGHKMVNEKDKEKCPFFQMQQKQQQQQQQQQTTEEPKKEKKVKKARGGCPVMPAEHRRNPGLSHLTESYDTNFITIFGYLLDQRSLWSLALDFKESNKGIFINLSEGSIEDRRKVFDSYPIYLKHTLLQDEENTKKMRQLDVSQRFLIYDKYREQGNKQYNKENYDEAMKYYERALGCFKWLEYVEPKDSDDENEEDINDNDDFDEEPKNEKEREEQEKIREEVKHYKKEQRELRRHYRKVCKVYTDENVKLMDPAETIPDESEKEMVMSMLFTLYLNMAVCYMKMSHYSLALKVLEEASKIQENNSQLEFRKSQAIAYDNWSTFKQLHKAKDHIEKGIEMSNHERIFKQEPGILRLMNLLNAKEMYVEQAHYVMDRINKKRLWIHERVEALFQRAKEIEEIEQEMIEDGKTPFEDGVSNVVDPPEVEVNPEESPKQKLYRVCGPQLLEEHQEFEIVQEMVRKYYRIIEFFLEQKKADQVKLAKKELQMLLATVQEMHFYLNLDFIDYENDEILRTLQKQYNIDLTNKKIIRRLHRLGREKASDIFSEGKFNFEVMDYAMNDYFKRKEQKRKEEEENEAQLQPPKKSWIKKWLFSIEFILTVIFFGLVSGIFYQVNRTNPILGTILNAKK